MILFTIVLLCGCVGFVGCVDFVWYLVKLVIMLVIDCGFDLL